MTRAMRGTRQQESPLRLNVARVHVPLSAILAAWVFRQLGRLTAWMMTGSARAVLRAPWLLVVAAVVVVLSRLTAGHRVAVLGVVVLLLVTSLGVWRWRWPESFTHQVGWRLRGAWRARSVYRYSWQPAMVTTGLAVTLDGAEYLPKLLRVSSRSSPWEWCIG